MGLLGTQTAYQYYNNSLKFEATAGQQLFSLLELDPTPTSISQIVVYLNNEELSSQYYTITGTDLDLNGFVTLDAGDQIVITLVSAKHGSYRYISIQDIISNFMIGYVGDGKIITKAKRPDVAFHVKRAIQEFSYDISRVEKIQEMEIGPNLSIPMPQDYVNYVQLSYVDDYGVEHPIQPGRISSKPSEAIMQDSSYNYQFDNEDGLLTSTSLTEERFAELNAVNLANNVDTDYSNEKLQELGKRYGGEPELMNSNGMFIIDEANGRFTFSSNLSGALITLKYISDGLGTDNEMKVHKFAEEAIYKHTAHALLASMINVPEYIVQRFKRDRRASMRNAKLRLSNLKLSELTNVMRGKSKQIKH